LLKASTGHALPNSNQDHYLFISKTVIMNSKEQGAVRGTAKNIGSKDSAYGSYQIAPNGDKITIDGNRTQIGSNVYFGEKSAKDALNKIGGK
jgi:hypothetical protein